MGELSCNSIMVLRRLTHSRGYRVKQRDLAYSLCSFQITRALEEHHALYESSRRAAAGPAGPGPGVYRPGVSVDPPAGDQPQTLGRGQWPQGGDPGPKSGDLSALSGGDLCGPAGGSLLSGAEEHLEDHRPPEK